MAVFLVHSRIRFIQRFIGSRRIWYLVLQAGGCTLKQRLADDRFLGSAHPYEEPAYEVYKIEDL